MTPQAPALSHCPDGISRPQLFCRCPNGNARHHHHIRFDPGNRSTSCHILSCRPIGNAWSVAAKRLPTTKPAIERRASRRAAYGGLFTEQEDFSRISTFRGRTPGCPGCPLTDPGVRFSRTGLLRNARLALVFSWRRQTIAGCRVPGCTASRLEVHPTLFLNRVPGWPNPLRRTESWECGCNYG